jgi:hypothetical protein
VRPAQTSTLAEGGKAGATTRGLSGIRIQFAEIIIKGSKGLTIFLLKIQQITV